MTTKHINVLMSGGGTGGHIYPAIAIVEALQAQCPNMDVLFVGADDRMEMDKVPAAGYTIEGLPIAGFQRGWTIPNLVRNLKLPFKIVQSLIQVYQIIKRFNPAIAIGTGGYASAPTLKMAQWMGIPTFIQEQNAQPGITNQFLAKDVTCAFVSYEESLNYFKGVKTFYTGNAIRQSFIKNEVNREQSLADFQLSPSRKTVLITGGSLGARAINEAIFSQFNKLMSHDIQLIWHTGQTHYSQYKHLENEKCKIYDFIYNMSAAYASSDLIVTRAGGILFELFVVGKPAIVLPSPYVADDHQTPNALALVNKNAAIMLRDTESKEKLVPTILDLIHDDMRLKDMGERMRQLAKPNAASDIATIILQTIDDHK